jgi:pimeloyl-ACP methyl ester carboxylesterase
VRTDDGVDLVYQSFGRGPAIVFANGIGVRYPGAVRQVQALRPCYRIITWDYRGMGPSVMSDPAGDVSMPRQALDALAIMDRLEVQRAIFVGWSMGVQVALEAIRLQPQRVAGFVALFGTYGQPFRTGLPGPLGRIVEGIFAFGKRHPMLPQLLLDFGTTFPWITFQALSRIAFVGRDVDREVFDVNVRGVAEVEKRLYLRTMLELAEHDAADMLPRVSCPAMIVSGQRDWLTPPPVARRMAEAIPDASYHELAGGTHFGLIEQVDRVNDWLLAFAKRVYLE